jgi:hypothetical protein
MTMKIPSMRSRVAIAVAAAAIVTAGLSGTASAATGGPDPGAVPAPYPGAVTAPDPSADAVLPVPPSAPVSTVVAAACQPYVDGDYAHPSTTVPGDVSAHGWWYQNNCPYVKTTVYMGLQEFYSDGSWRTKATNSAGEYPGKSHKANVRTACQNGEYTGWRSYIIVHIGNGASANTIGQNLYCRVY